MAEEQLVQEHPTEPKVVAGHASDNFKRRQLKAMEWLR
jgi:hypothetical protein